MMEASAGVGAARRGTRCMTPDPWLAKATMTVGSKHESRQNAFYARGMTNSLTITMAQLTQKVGDLRGNADAMLAARNAKPDSDLIVFPELQLIGYPPEDLVLKPAVWERAEAELQRLLEEVRRRLDIPEAFVMIKDGRSLI